MKVKITVLMFIWFLPGLFFSKEIKLYNIDSRNFPIIKANFYAFDEEEIQLIPNRQDLKIFENDVEREIISVTCPTPQPPKPISSVLTIDVSGSMEGRNLELAKAGANAWINYLSLGVSECAITSFDHFNYLIQDFTTHKQMLTESIKKLNPDGATSFNAALIDPMAGALLISGSGKNNKVIVLLTDGMAELTMKREVLELAASQNCKIYVVTLEGYCPNDLKDVALQTGGLWFDRIRTISEIEEVYKNILQIVQNDSPCTIEWLSNNTCFSEKTRVDLLWDGIQGYSEYFPPDNSLAELKVTPYKITFGRRELGIRYDTTITLIAINSDFNIASINQKFGSTTDFEFRDLILPLNIPENTSKNIKLSYLPKDSSFNYVGFEILSDVCNSFFSMNGGYYNNFNIPKNLKLTHPNGDEFFVIGSDTVITWEGIIPSEVVTLEYSIDNGKNWIEIADNASNLMYKWEDIPPPVSNECLVKVLQVKKKSSNENHCLWTSDLHSNDVNCVAFSPNGGYVASGSDDKTIHINDAYTGKLIQKLEGNWNSVECLTFSPDNNFLVSGAWGELYLWNLNTGQAINNFHSNGTVSSVVYHPSGKKLASAGYNLIEIWNTNTWITEKQIQINGNILNIDYDYSGNRIAVGTTVGKVLVIDANTGIELLSISDFTSYIYSVQFSPDDTKVLSAGIDGKIRIWDSRTGKHIRTISAHQSTIYSIAISPDGMRIASAGIDGAVKTWNFETGELITTLKGHIYGVRSVRFDPFGILIASGGDDNLVKVWELDDIQIQSDISDNTFSIVKPMADALDIDLNLCYVGQSKDSTINEFVFNKDNWKFRVDSIYIRGNDAFAFSLVSGLPVYHVEGNSSYSGEFRFSPKEGRVYNADIVIVTQNEEIYKKIRGEGVNNPLELSTSIIDFGRVEIGSSKDTLKSATIKNVSDEVIVIKNTRHSYPNDRDFMTISGGGDFSLEPGETRYMDIRFTPAMEGRTNGTILFDYESFGSPAKIQLFGEGIISFPKISSSVQNSLEILCDETAQTEILLYNIGGTPLIVNKLILTGPDKNDFNVYKILPVTILPNDSTEILIDFSPGSIGEKTTYLEVTSNAVPDSVFVMEIIGKKEKVELSAEEFIDFGVLCPNEEIEFEFTIENKSTTDVSALISSTNNIELVSKEVNLKIGQIQKIRAILKGFDNVGEIVEKITLTDDICHRKLEITLKGTVVFPELTTNNIEIKSVLGYTSQDKLRLFNSSERNITINGISNIIEPFRIIENPFPYYLESNSHLDLTVEFNPLDTNVYNQSILVNVDECNYIKEVQLTGLPFPSSLNLSIGSYEAFPGDEIIIPIMINNPDNFNLLDFGQISFDLYFNPTLINPVGYIANHINDRLAKIEIRDLNLYDVSNNVIEKIKFKVGLGNAENCELEIDNAKFSNSFWNLSLVNGSFKLLGICFEGGIRLLNPSGSENIISVSPNPVSNDLNILLNLIEKGLTSLIITNSIGNVVLYQNFINETGNIELTVDSTKFSNGVYIINLKTPTINKTIKFLVNR
ncbi:MAG: choice-of-anchor D domain-containing protein [Candidatus Kapabacteria bacterium]|nr:choice-of-anchor D domain-containing protein [Ignavibacteriota bacterium]MCW5884702.1 choice-of-anchor D domain-containing protein [Candidatus Kapabacteria bacterium]